MTLPLNTEMLEACYEFLKTSPPFNSWGLPDVDDVKFIVIRDKNTAGYHKMTAGRHVIGISSGAIGRTHSLVEVMAHEMVHAHQRETNMETKGSTHNAAFNRLAARVCEVHGFDPKLF